MDTLFMRLAAIYGYLWVTTYSNPTFLDLAKREWSESLHEFDNQVLKLALEHMKKTQSVPPCLPAFYECCSTLKKNIEARQEALKQKAEVRAPTDPKIVQFHINKMKESLFKNSKERKSC